MDSQKKTHINPFIKDIVIAIVLAIIVSMIIKPICVSGRSMEPTLHSGDYLISYKLFNFDKLKRGDIVTFRYSDGRLFIKRIIGLPGDKVKILDGKVYVNGKPDDQSYTLNQTTDGEVDITVPDKELFCLGDNRLESHDSRENDVGCIDKKNVNGKVFVRLFPITRIGALK